MQSTASSNVTLRTEGAVASFVTLKTGEMNKTFSQFMNRWMCSLVAHCVQIIAGKDSCGRTSCPPPTGGKTAAEGEVDLAVFILSPCSKRHYDNRAVVLSAKLHCLLSNNMGSFSRIMALVNEVTDLLTVHHEVNTICSKDQEAVICMM